MSSYINSDGKKAVFLKEDFEIHTLQDEIHAEQLCGRLLEIFFRTLVERDKFSALEAGALARGADYFLREFLIPDRRENIFFPRPGRVRQFAGNWYIIRNMEPNMKELQSILQGVEIFYEFCRSIGKVSLAVVEQIQGECRDANFYRKRIEDFWNIEGDGFLEWEKACTLKD
jgi:hypothetical protein